MKKFYTHMHMGRGKKKKKEHFRRFQKIKDQKIKKKSWMDSLIFQLQQLLHYISVYSLLLAHSVQQEQHQQ